MGISWLVADQQVSIQNQTDSSFFQCRSSLIGIQHLLGVPTSTFLQRIPLSLTPGHSHPNIYVLNVGHLPGGPWVQTVTLGYRIWQWQGCDCQSDLVWVCSKIADAVGPFRSPQNNCLWFLSSFSKMRSRDPAQQVPESQRSYGGWPIAVLNYRAQLLQLTGFAKRFFVATHLKPKPMWCPH